MAYGAVFKLGQVSELDAFWDNRMEWSVYKFLAIVFTGDLRLK